MKRETDTTKRVRGSRRRYDAAFKQEVVEKTLLPGASVAAVALEHRLNANLLFTWRRAHLRHRARQLPAPAATMLPVMVETTANETVSSRARAVPSVIEIELPAGRIRLRGAVDAAALRVVIELLSSR